VSSSDEPGTRTSTTAAADGGSPFRGSDPRPAGPAGPLRDGSGPALIPDLFAVLVGPTAFWERPRALQGATARPIWIHLAVLIGLRSAAGFGGALLRSAGFGIAFGQLISGILSSFLMVWLFAAIVASVAATSGGRANVRDAFRYAAYGLTPMFAIGVLAVVPLPYVSPIADLALMPYTFYVLAVGVVPALGVAVERAPGRTGIICGALLLLWTVIPALIPLLVETLFR
jgi:hypothetical protein